MAVHAARLFLGELNPEKAVLKLDFSNAFNTIRRDKMMGAISEHVPELYPFVHLAYCATSSLFWGENTIQFAEGVQQGDPLGPLLFCLSIHRMCTLLKSEFSLFYLDDGTLGGSRDDLMHDLEVVEQEEAAVGLRLNKGKSEIICASRDTSDSLLPSLPGAQVVDPVNATLLGSSIGDVSSFLVIFDAKADMLKRMVSGSNISLPKMLFTF